MSKFIKHIFYKQRAAFMADLPQREQRFSLPKDVIEEKNIAYSTDGASAHHLDVYHPSSQKDSSLPVILNIHGGGLILGCKEFNRYFCAQLCKLGYLVFNLEYRLVPDCLFYDQCNDIFLAMEYIRQHLSSFHGTSDQIYAVGDSGGACLLTYCCAMQNCDAISRAAGVQPSSLKLKGLGLISGMFYTNKLDSIGLFLPKYLYGTSYKKGPFAPYVNPEHPALVKALLPCILVTSHNDSLRNYTLQFEKALTKYQVPHTLLDFPAKKELTHAFSVFEPFLPESLEVQKAISDFFCRIDSERK